MAGRTRVMSGGEPTTPVRPPRRRAPGHSAIEGRRPEATDGPSATRTAPSREASAEGLPRRTDLSGPPDPDPPVAVHSLSGPSHRRLATGRGTGPGEWAGIGSRVPMSRVPPRARAREPTRSPAAGVCRPGASASGGIGVRSRTAGRPDGRTGSRLGGRGCRLFDGVHRGSSSRPLGAGSAPGCLRACAAFSARGPERPEPLPRRGVMSTEQRPVVRGQAASGVPGRPLVRRVQRDDGRARLRDHVTVRRGSWR